MATKFIASDRTASERIKSFEVKQEEKGVLITLPASEWLFAQDTIVTSVMLEQGSSHLIRPETSKFVNKNGNAWSNESLKANYQSFIGGYNFMNHIQKHDQAYGFVVDAVLRKIQVEENVFVYYCDILVATNREANPILTKGLISGDIKFLSMGCVANCTCSRCGHQYGPEGTYPCEHIMGMQQGKYYVDDYGVRRVVAELLGTNEPGTCIFQEASYLTEIPAADSAVLRNIVPLNPELDVEFAMTYEQFDKPAVKKFLQPNLTNYQTIDDWNRALM